MTKSHALIAPLLTLTTVTLTAAPRDLNEARRLASTHFQSVNTTSNALVAPVRELSELMLVLEAPTASTADEPAYYLFAPASGKGFVAVSGEDLMPSTIIGYSADATCDPANLPPALEAYLADYALLVDAVRSGAQLSYTSATEADSAKATIGPLVSCQWGQDAPYNNLTPSKYVTGCVATAMAQVMYYHQYPDHGYGSGAPASPTTSAIDFTTSTYDWANMKDTYTSYTTDQKQAIATLMRDVGYAVRMQYASKASGAYSFDIPEALVCNFNYDPSMIADYERTTWSTPAWTALIRAELEAGQPIIYSGESDNGGHCFVCDGIDSRDFLHINWGWDGYYNGFFDMNILCAENYNVVVDKSSAFYYSQDMVCGIRPGNPDADQSNWHSAPILETLYANNTIDAETGIIKSNSSSQLTLSVFYKLVNTTRRQLSSDNCVIYLTTLNADGSVHTTSRDFVPTISSAYSTSRTVKIEQDITTFGNYYYTFRYLDKSSMYPDSLREFTHGDLIQPLGVSYINYMMTAINPSTFNKATTKMTLVSAEMNQEPTADVATPSGTTLTIGLRNDSWSPYEFTSMRVGFCKLNDDLTPTSDYTYLSTRLAYLIYPGTEMEFTLPASKVTLSEGTYQVVATSTTAADQFLIHVASDANAIGSTRADGARLVYNAQARTLTLHNAESATDVTIVSATGIVAARLRLEPGVAQRLQLSAGAYVITSTAGNLKVVL